MIFYTTHHSSSTRYLLHAEVVYLVVVKYKETVVLLKTFFLVFQEMQDYLSDWSPKL